MSVSISPLRMNIETKGKKKETEAAPRVCRCFFGVSRTTVEMCLPDLVVLSHN